MKVLAISTMFFLSSLFSQSFADEDDSLSVLFKFSIRTCSGGIGEPLECVDKNLEKRNVELPMMDNGGSCLNLDVKSQGLESQLLQEVKPSNLNTGLACVYASYRDSSFSGLYLPLFLIERTGDGVSNLKLSVARSANGKTRLQVADFTVRGEILELGSLSYKLRGEEISRSQTQIVYPIFEVSIL